MGRRVLIGAAIGLVGFLGGCSAAPGSPPPTPPAVALEHLMDLVPGDSRVLMGMGAVEETGVNAVARLGAYEGTKLTMVAVCGGPGTLRLELEHDHSMAVPCNRKVITAEILVTTGTRPGTVSISLEPGNSYSTLVYAAGSALGT